MKANYVQRGNRIDYTNSTETDIEFGEVVLLGGRIAVAADTIAAGNTGVVKLVGAYSMTKASGEEISIGDVVYYDAKSDCITATAGDNTAAGFAVESRAAADTSIIVRIG